MYRPTRPTEACVLATEATEGVKLLSEVIHQEELFLFVVTV